MRALVAITLLLVGCGSSNEPVVEPPGPPVEMTVMTFNVLCSFCSGDMYDAWEERVVDFADLFARHDADLIGLQELSFDFEVELIQSLLPDDYGALFYAADGSNFTYPDATVLYRRSRFEVVQSGEYWLSPTPDVPSSSGFASPQLPRLVVWSELRDKLSRRPLYFATSHVDNNSPSQEKSAPLILARSAPWQAKMPVILVGDFNSKPTTEAYRILTEGDGQPPLANAFDHAASWSVDHNQPSEPDYPLEDRIDHMFIGPEPTSWSVAEWIVDLHVYGALDRYPSDHRAMVMTLTAPAD